MAFYRLANYELISAALPANDCTYTQKRASVIMISGHGTLADAVRATKAGAYDFIEKPLDRERLMVTLRNGDVPKYETFAEGWLDGAGFWGRPVYTQQMKDGSLLISDDYAGAIFRVTYQR